MARERSEVSATERLRVAARAAQLAVWEWSAASDELTWSGDAGPLLGLPDAPGPTRFAGFLHRIDEVDMTVLQRHVEATLTGTDQHFAVDCRVRTADDRWVRCTGEARLDEIGAVAGVIGTIADITATKLLEAQLRQAQKMESMGHLAGGLAHDFNNVLTVIRGEAQCCRLHEDVSNKTLASLDNIEGAAERGRELTRQLLTFARHQSGRSVPLDVGAFLRELQPLLRRLAGNHVHLELDLDESLPAVRANRSQLEQVFMNLVANAKDAMDSQGAIHITGKRLAPPPPDRVGEGRPPGPAADATRWIEIRVADSGPGIPGPTRDRLFEPFYTTKAKGTGLGLSTSHGIIRQHGGELALVDPLTDGTSDSAIGATFSIRLPGIDAANEPAGTERGTAVAATRPPSAAQREESGSAGGEPGPPGGRPGPPGGRPGPPGGRPGPPGGRPGPAAGTNS